MRISAQMANALFHRSDRSEPGPTELPRSNGPRGGDHFTMSRAIGAGLGLGTLTMVSCASSAASAANDAHFVPASTISVSQLQTLLAKKQIYFGKIDGKMNAATKQAIIDFQRAAKLPIDGRLGARTIAALQSPTALGATGVTKSGPTATAHMSTAAKYDHYAKLITSNGGTLIAGKKNIVGIRTENHKSGVYDDRVAVIWKDQNGAKRVVELAANLESQIGNRGRFGRDMNRDGVRDLGSLAPGTYTYGWSTSTGKGRVLRPLRPTPMMRDTDVDGRGDRLDPAGAGLSVLFHMAGVRNVSSAGCQTFSPNEWARLMSTLGSQKTFQYTIVDAR